MIFDMVDVFGELKNVNSSDTKMNPEKDPWTFKIGPFNAFYLLPLGPIRWKEMKAGYLPLLGWRNSGGGYPMFANFSLPKNYLPPQWSLDTP